mmetsp:Transcript_10331/g.18476  ORF Transcript_10331/g.18476 Transcript_10331/m.18476 type:complete len:209 (-) Transcript_10331:158-784(-)
MTDRFGHVVNGQGSHGGPRQCFHFDACLVVDTARTLNSDNSSRTATVLVGSNLLFQLDINLNLIQWQRMAEGNEVARVLGCHDTGNFGGCKDGPFWSHKFLLLMTIVLLLLLLVHDDVPTHLVVDHDVILLVIVLLGGSHDHDVFLVIDIFYLSLLLLRRCDAIFHETFDFGSSSTTLLLFYVVIVLGVSTVVFRTTILVMRGMLFAV